MPLYNGPYMTREEAQAEYDSQTPEQKEAADKFLMDLKQQLHDALVWLMNR